MGRASYCNHWSFVDVSAWRRRLPGGLAPTESTDDRREGLEGHGDGFTIGGNGEEGPDALPASTHREEAGRVEGHAVQREWPRFRRRGVGMSPARQEAVDAPSARRPTMKRIAIPLALLAALGCTQRK